MPVPVQVGSPGSYTVIHGASRASRSRDWQRGTWVKPGSALLLSCLSPPSPPSTPTRPGSSHLKQPCICKMRNNHPIANLYTRPSVCQVMYPPQERRQHWESQQDDTHKHARSLTQSRVKFTRGKSLPPLERTRTSRWKKKLPEAPAGDCGEINTRRHSCTSSQLAGTHQGVRSRPCP